MAKKFYSVLDLRPDFSAGTWTTSIASNIPTSVKVAADETPVVSFPIPRYLFGSGAGEPKVVSAACQYTVATAALDAAPSMVFNTITLTESTGALARAAAADTTTISGTDTTGTAAGTFLVKGALDQPLTLSDTEFLTCAFTYDCAATTVLTIRGLWIETA